MKTNEQNSKGLLIIRAKCS